MLVGQDREGFDRNQFPALCLLPFTEEQIQDYLASFLGDRSGGPRHSTSSPPSTICGTWRSGPTCSPSSVAASGSWSSSRPEARR